MRDFALHTSRPILVTGAAGFIGFHVSLLLLEEGFLVIGYDNVNDYYDVGLKRSRLAILGEHAGFSFIESDLCDYAAVLGVFRDSRPDYVVHLAAQAGVRYSLESPHAYVRSNIEGFLNILEACREFPVKHLLYASSGSVYGDSDGVGVGVGDGVGGGSSGDLVAFRESDRTDSPISFYGVTKKSNELMGYCYSRLHGLSITGLRFFSVYGAWGRPDMAFFLFGRAILLGEPITLFNDGDMVRDFTYIDDVVGGVRRILARPAVDGVHGVSHALYNIGASRPESLPHLVELLERELGATADVRYASIQAGDLQNTYADCENLFTAVGYRPATSLSDGVRYFCDWYKGYFSLV